MREFWRLPLQSKGGKQMQMEVEMEVETLTHLLSKLHQELKTCMENKQKRGFDEELHDPIFLGDFIVDTYNEYLAAAKSVCEHPLIQTMPEIEKLGEADPADHDIKKGVGSHPRLIKMREVAFATEQLQTFLAESVQREADKAQHELAGVVTLLENLGEQIEQANRPELGRVLDNSAESRQSVQYLVSEYNRYLVTVLEATDDSVIKKMFHSLEVGDEGTSDQAKLSEVRLAQSGLLSYLKTTIVPLGSTRKLSLPG
jgi:hypothetical protein